MWFQKLFKIPYWYLIAIPLLSIGLGTVSNQVVLWSNHDQFPVMYNDEKIHQSCQTPDPTAPTDLLTLLMGPKAPKKDAPSILKPQPAKDADLCQNGGIFLDDTHVIMTKDSKLKFLADIWDFHEVTYSIGDFFLMFAEWMLSWAPLAWLVLVIRKFIEG
jgi:hypothetical protein